MTSDEVCSMSGLQPHRFAVTVWQAACVMLHAFIWVSLQQAFR